MNNGTRNAASASRGMEDMEEGVEQKDGEGEEGSL
jgi:hypothetical protein